MPINEDLSGMIYVLSWRLDCFKSMTLNFKSKSNALSYCHANNVGLFQHPKKTCLLVTIPRIQTIFYVQNFRSAIQMPPNSTRVIESIQRPTSTFDMSYLVAVYPICTMLTCSTFLFVVSSPNESCTFCVKYKAEVTVPSVELKKAMGSFRHPLPVPNTSRQFHDLPPIKWMCFDVSDAWLW